MRLIMNPMDHRSQALSTSQQDLLKNTALCYLRLHGVITVANKFPQELKRQYEDTNIRDILLNPMKEIMYYASTENLIRISNTTAHVVSAFLNQCPSDRDAAAFSLALTKILK